MNPADLARQGINADAARSGEWQELGASRPSCQVLVKAGAMLTDSHGGFSGSISLGRPGGGWWSRLRDHILLPHSAYGVRGLIPRTVGLLLGRNPGHASHRNYVLLSGGIDSASCVAFYLRLGHAVTGVFVDYRQPPRAQEEHSARAVAAHYSIPLEVIRCDGQQTNYSTEIRGRNAFLVFAALLFAPIQKGVISLGIHRGTPYYDCSELFAADAARIVSGYTNGRVTLGVPFLTWDKGMIHQFAREAGVPVALTWSCEVGPAVPCGQCMSCRDREVLHARSSD